MDDERVLKLAQAEWQRTGFAGNGDASLQRINEIRQDGLAYDLDEHTIGISAIGFAFKDWSGEIHSISVPIPSSRYAASLAVVEKSLRKAKERIKGLVKG